MTKLKAITPIDSPLYVVTAIINPSRYITRYKLYREFEERLLATNAKLITAYATFGERHSELDNPNVTYIRLQSESEVWHKERMLNLAISRLPPDWKYVAWLDSDIAFARPDWVEETVHLLQHYDILQLFSSAADLSPDFKVLHTHTGFVYCYKSGLIPGKSYESWHPGFAWAARRTAINDLGGLFDFGILGAGDRHMATGFIGRVDDSFPAEVKLKCQNYYNKLVIWQDRALKYIKYNIGYMPGIIWHYWHGKKADRKYRSRWNILADNEYDPELDLKDDWQGMWALTDRNPKFKAQLQEYFKQRNEDSIDI